MRTSKEPFKFTAKGILSIIYLCTSESIYVLFMMGLIFTGLGAKCP